MHLGWLLLATLAVWSHAAAEPGPDPKFRRPKWNRWPEFHADVWFTDERKGDGQRIDNFRELMQVAEQVRRMRYFSSDTLGLPPEIGYFRNLRELDLSFYQGFALPKELWTLDRLESLEISWDGELAIDPGIQRLRRLRRLDLQGSPAHAIILPDKLGQMRQLQELELSRAGSVRFPASIDWPELHSLSMNSVPVDPWPAGLEKCPVDSLTLYSDSLRTVPEAIRAYKGLRVIDLAWNQLDDLPEFMLEFGQLRSLGIAINGFDTLPEVVTRMTQLESLAAHGNPGMVVPAGIGKLRNLHELLLSHCLLDSLPATIGDLQVLEALWIGGNRLKNLPASLGKCKQLKMLRAGGNPLEALPVEIVRLPLLEEYHFETKGLLDVDAEVWAFLNREGFLVPAVPESIAGQPLGYYLSREDIDKGSKLYLQGKLRLRYDRLYMSIMDSVGTSNPGTQPYYLHLLTTFLRPVDADTSIKTLYIAEPGANQVKEACARAMLECPKWFIENIMHGPWKHLYWQWLAEVPIEMSGIRWRTELVPKMKENMGAEEAAAYEKDFFQLTWDLIEVRR